MAWTKITEALPDPDKDRRVLIHTEGYDFAGEQFFDVKADNLHPMLDADGTDIRPEVCQYASHWMPLPRLSLLISDDAAEIERLRADYQDLAVHHNAHCSCCEVY